MRRRIMYRVAVVRPKETRLFSVAWTNTEPVSLLNTTAELGFRLFQINFFGARSNKLFEMRGLNTRASTLRAMASSLPSWVSSLEGWGLSRFRYAAASVTAVPRNARQTAVAASH